MSATGSEVADTGRMGYTVAKRTGYAQGLYDVIFNTACPNSKYAYMVTPIGAFAPITLGAEASKSKLSAHTYTGAGASVDCDIFYIVEQIFFTNALTTKS